MQVQRQKNSRTTETGSREYFSKIIRKSLYTVISERNEGKSYTLPTTASYLYFKELIFFFFLIWKALKKNHGNFLWKYGNNLIFFKLSIIVLQV